MKHFWVLLLLICISGCYAQSFKAVKLTDKGYLPTQYKAKIVKSVPVDLDSKKDILLVGITPLDFHKSQLQNIGYFDKLLTHEELEKIIVQEGLTDRVRTVYGQIGINSAARHYRNFLWWTFEGRQENGKKYLQYKLVDALTLDEYFVVESAVHGYESDLRNNYPMFNALIDYIKSNSRIYTASAK